MRDFTLCRYLEVEMVDHVEDEIVGSSITRNLLCV
jgi:hypothetical protein